MDIKATTDEIHRKLDKLGLSHRGKDWYVFDPDNFTIGNVVRFDLSLKRGDLTLDLMVTKRNILMAWILFGGKLRYKR